MCCINSLFVSQLSVQKTPPLLPAAIFTERKDVDLNSDPQTASGSVWTYAISSSAARPAVRVPGLGAGILRRRGSSAQQKRGAREASRYTGQGGKDAAELTEGFTTEKTACVGFACCSWSFIYNEATVCSQWGDGHPGLWQNNAGMSGKKTVEPGSTIGASWRTEVHISSTLACSLPAPVTLLLLQTH